MKWRGLRALLLGFALAACGGTATADEGLQASEPKVKAAFLFKFGDYVEWPTGSFASPSAPLVIGVLDADALADELAAIVVGRSVAGRPVAVRKLRRGDPLSGLNVVFIGQATGGNLAEVLSPIGGQPTLVVTESADGLRRGGIINFVVLSEKVRFDVSLPSAQARGLKVSSRLLAVARKVVLSPP